MSPACGWWWSRSSCKPFARSSQAGFPTGCLWPAPESLSRRPRTNPLVASFRPHQNTRQLAPQMTHPKSELDRHQIPGTANPTLGGLPSHNHCSQDPSPQPVSVEYNAPSTEMLTAIKAHLQQECIPNTHKGYSWSTQLR